LKKKRAGEASQAKKLSIVSIYFDTPTRRERARERKKKRKATPRESTTTGYSIYDDILLHEREREQQQQQKQL
jgi:hypothetical protein